MCGIIGSVGNFNHYEVVLKGLKRLEYRGYDSSGLGYLDGENIKVTKTPNSISILEKKVKPFVSKLAIGHTRWATHGKIAYENTHPFISQKGLFALVHNGTINNYLELKNELVCNGYSFDGETDSEVIVNYLEYLFLNNNDVLLSIDQLDKKLEGSYSLVIIYKEEEKLYFLKNQISLLITKEKDGFIICSDLYANAKENITYFELENHQYGYVCENEIKVFSNQNEEKYHFTNIKVDQEELKEIGCYLEKEIEECPLVLDKEIQYYIEHKELLINNEKLVNKIKNCKKIYVIGCGTSYHAGLIFKRLLPFNNVEVILASEFIYSQYKFDESDLFIFLSQSGETLDVIKSINKVKNHFLIGITNNDESTIARNVNLHFPIKVNKEISVASTKAYFGEVVVLYLISNLINKDDLYDLKILPSKIKEILRRKEEILEMAKEIKKYPSLYFLGKGIDYDVCLECSLKLKEISYLHSEAIYMGELKHGPLALVNKNFPVIIISTNKDLIDVINTSKKEIETRGGKIFQFDCDYSYNFNYLLQVYWGDILSLFVGRLLKVNIDKPRNLAKSVTVE